MGTSGLLGARQTATPRQRGFTLVELLVALPIAALVASITTLLLLRQVQHIRASEAHSDNVRELRHTRLILETDLAPLHPSDLSIISDSLLEFHAQIGVGILCELEEPARLLVASPDAGGWLSGVRPGDRITLWNWSFAPSASPSPTTATLHHHPVALGPGTCGPHQDVPRWRLEVDALPTATRIAGAPVRVQRLTRYSLYRSGSRWWFGRRSHDLSGWDVVQPIAGPLASASHGGMRARTIDALGNVVSHAAGTHDSAAAIQVELRAPRAMTTAPSRSMEDTLLFEVTLRGALGVRHP